MYVTRLYVTKLCGKCGRRRPRRSTRGADLKTRTHTILWGTTMQLKLKNSWKSEMHGNANMTFPSPLFLLGAPVEDVNIFAVANYKLLLVKSAGATKCKWHFRDVSTSSAYIQLQIANEDLKWRKSERYKMNPTTKILAQVLSWGTKQPWPAFCTVAQVQPLCSGNLIKDIYIYIYAY